MKKNQYLDMSKIHTIPIKSKPVRVIQEMDGAITLAISITIGAVAAFTFAAFQKDDELIFDKYFSKKMEPFVDILKDFSKNKLTYDELRNEINKLKPTLNDVEMYGKKVLYSTEPVDLQTVSSLLMIIYLKVLTLQEPTTNLLNDINSSLESINQAKKSAEKLYNFQLDFYADLRKKNALLNESLIAMMGTAAILYPLLLKFKYKFVKNKKIPDEIFKIVDNLALKRIPEDVAYNNLFIYSDFIIKQSELLLKNKSNLDRNAYNLCYLLTAFAILKKNFDIVPKIKNLIDLSNDLNNKKEDLLNKTRKLISEHYI